MSSYAITFGQKYFQDPHPHFILKDIPDLPNWFWVVEAEGPYEAESWAMLLFDQEWSMIRPLEEVGLEYFPKGRINPQLKAGDRVMHLLDTGLDYRNVRAVMGDELWLGISGQIGPFPVNQYLNVAWKEAQDE